MRSKFEIASAKRLRDDGLTFKEISQILGISIHSARGLCVNKRISNLKKRGPKFKLNSYCKLKVKRCISALKNDGQKVNCTKIKNACNLNISTRTIQRHLSKMCFTYKKAKSQLVLSKYHKQKRLDIVSQWIADNHNWEKTVFSDEKRFSLDGSDYWMSYTGVSEKIVRPKRQCRGGSVMVWLMVIPNGLLSYRFIRTNFKAKDYLDVLKEMIVPIIRLNMGSDFYYQEDNCSIHKASIIKKFMTDSSINVIQWPAKSPDLNIVEDIWSMISHNVYDRMPYQNLTELEERISSTILDINLNRRQDIQNLYATIRNRLCIVLKKQGNLCNK